MLPALECPELCKNECNETSSFCDCGSATCKCKAVFYKDDCVMDLWLLLDANMANVLPNILAESFLLQAKRAFVMRVGLDLFVSSILALIQAKLAQIMLPVLP